MNDHPSSLTGSSCITSHDTPSVPRETGTEAADASVHNPHTHNPPHEQQQQQQCGLGSSRDDSRNGGAASRRRNDGGYNDSNDDDGGGGGETNRDGDDSCGGTHDDGRSRIGPLRRSESNHFPQRRLLVKEVTPLMSLGAATSPAAAVGGEGEELTSSASSSPLSSSSSRPDDRIGLAGGFVIPKLRMIGDGLFEEIPSINGLFEETQPN
eukprot:GHVU01229313.1.p1 GENE.GHVU01229313.1~~GHVU01229313.1.p1  ORF type:complete len:210 (+),score=38.09 GHVU01229313.1:373-1002(+)